MILIAEYFCVFVLGRQEPVHVLQLLTCVPPRV